MKPPQLKKTAMAHPPFASWAIAQPGSNCTLRGAKVLRQEMPAPGYKWNELNALNETIYQNQKGWTWSATCEALEGAHVRLLDELHNASEAELYDGLLAPSLKWTRGRYAEAAGASHYRSAAHVLRKLKKEIS